MTTSFCSKVCLIVLAFALWPVSCAWADPAATAPVKCSTGTADEILQAVKSNGLKRVPAYVDWGPSGEPLSVAIRPPAKGVDASKEIKPTFSR